MPLSSRFIIMHNRIFALILVLATSFSVMAQREQDALLWMNVSLEKKITRKVSLFVEPNIRVNQNISSVENIFSDFGLGYKFKGPFSASLNYRTGLNRNKELQFLSYHRVYVDGSFKEKIADKIRIAIRLRYQQQISAAQREEDWDDVRKTVRVRLKLAPKWNKRITPSISNELFYRVNFEDRGWNRMRISGGAEYAIDKRKSLELYYTHQRAILQMGTDVEHIYGVSFSWTL